MAYSRFFLLLSPNERNVKTYRDSSTLPRYPQNTALAVRLGELVGEGGGSALHRPPGPDGAGHVHRDEPLLPGYGLLVMDRCGEPVHQQE